MGQKSLKAQMQQYAALRRRPCSSCGQVKGFDQFSACSKERLGIRYHCKECVFRKEAVRRDPQRERARARNYRKANPEKERDRVKRWRQENPQRYRDIDKSWRDRNPDKTRAQSQRFYGKQRKSEKFRLQVAVKAMVRAKLLGKSKSNRRTFDLLGYSIDDLKAHLERKFVGGMSWENYGREGWHIDHIIPLAAHNYTSPDDLDFKRAWALSNLRPLWAFENRSKGARLLKPFQPSLAI